MESESTGRTKIAVIGCGRSGTKFISEYLNLGHEKYGENGIADWSLTTDGYFSEHIDGLIYIHQVRHPLDTISSCQTLADTSWEFIERYISFGNDCLIRKCMKYWYYWNLYAEEKAEFTYRVESIKQSKANTRPHSSLTWHTLEQIDMNLTYKIKQLAIKYGYLVSF